MEKLKLLLDKKLFVDSDDVKFVHLHRIFDPFAFKRNFKYQYKQKKLPNQDEVEYNPTLRTLASTLIMQTSYS